MKELNKMIIDDNYTKEYILSLKGNRGVDAAIIERNIYALKLAEALRLAGLDFIFKSGTCLTILMDEPLRLSTDVDGTVPKGTDIDFYIKKASEIFPFTAVRYKQKDEANKSVMMELKKDTTSLNVINLNSMMIM